MAVIARSIAQIGAGAIIVFLIGWWQGHPLVFLTAYGLGLSVWQLWQQLRFDNWLHDFGDNNLTGRWSQMAQRVADRLAKERHQNLDTESKLGDFRDLVRNFPDGIVMLEKDLQIVWFNTAASALLGLAARDAGQRINNLIRDPEFFDFSQKADSLQFIESPKDGSRSLSLQMVDVMDRKILVVKDVTAYKKSELARQDFVANASHELRSPLTVIRGYLDALATENTLDPVWHDPVQEMLRQAQRMSDLLTDLMDLSRLDRMHLKAEWHPIDMAALIERVKNESCQLPGKKCRIDTSVDSTHDLLGEHSEILTATTNLVANAVRYSGDNCKVFISWTVDDDGGHLAIEDNGIGIPDEDIPRITERFYRVDKGRSREKGGTGLGLAIVRNTLSRHEGRLEIQSKLGEGSVFICHFPSSRVTPASANVQATG